MSVTRLLLSLPLLFSTIIAPGPLSILAPLATQVSGVRIHANFRTLPLSFELNQGQSDSRVKFLAHGSGYALFLTSTEAVLHISTPSRPVPIIPSPRNPGTTERRTPRQESVVRFRPIGGARHPQLVALDRLAGTVNYLIGNVPRRWHTDVPAYARVAYRNVYPGIELAYYGRQGHLECDWVLQPGANVNVIRLRVDGAGRLQLDREGDLVLRSGAVTMVQSRPRIYQEIGAARRAISGHYALVGPHEVGFKIAPHDPAHPLIIDPVLLYSTYLGGSDSDQSNGIALDGATDAYITGSTTSSNFPTANARQTAAAGSDAFVTKLNSTGTALIYSTYLGGMGEDGGSGIAVDSQGNGYVTGTTKSADFPTVNGLSTPTDCLPGPLIPEGSKLCSEYKGFVVKLNSAGDGLVFSTYLSGNCCDDFGSGIATDSAGNAYVTGLAFSDNFPITPRAYQATHRGFTDAFVAKFGATGNLIYSTYLGGDNFEGGEGIAVDGSGNAYVAGYTDSTNFPTANPSQASLGGTCPGGDTVCSDAFVAKLSPDGSALIYSTYLGGQDEDSAAGIALDTAGNDYVIGTTKSVNFPIVNALSGSNGGGSCKDRDGKSTSCTDAFVAKLSAAGALVYSTYLGGAGNDQGSGIAVDRAGAAVVVGTTEATNFPIANAIQPALGGGSCVERSGNAALCTDAFVAELGSAGNNLIYSTYLGGPGNNTGSAVTLDSAGAAYVTGSTTSTGFPVKNALQASSGGASDAFLVKLGELPTTPTPMPPTATSTPAPPTATSTSTPATTPKRLHVAIRGTLRVNRSSTLRIMVSDPAPAIQPRTNSNGPVRGATVHLDARPVGIRKTLKTTTDGRGVATFQDVHPVRPGAATLKVSKPGFPSVTLRIRVSP